jgi:hypothetical protein
MYDRDYVKALEREIELTGDNRFRGWQLSADPRNGSKSGQGENAPNTTTRKISGK